MSKQRLPSLSRALVWRLTAVVGIGLCIGYAIIYFEFRVGLMGLEGQSIAVQVQDLRQAVDADAARPFVRLSPQMQTFYASPGALNGYQLLALSGDVLDAAGFSVAYLPMPMAQAGNEVVMQHARDPQTGQDILAAALQVDTPSGSYWLRVVRNLEDRESLVAQLMLSALGELLPTLPLIFIPLIAVVIFTVHSSLRALRDVSRQATTLSASNLDQRLQERDLPQEVLPLVKAVNTALDRLEADYRAQRDFTANAAHELRTPLAVLRARLESKFRATELGDVTAEIEQLARLVEQLLCLAHLDSTSEFESEEFDAYALALEVARDVAPRAVLSDHSISAVEGAPMLARGSPTLLRLVFRNLLENAIHHTPAGTCIQISMRDSRTLSIEDDGPGIPLDEVATLFERFRRGRRAAHPGAGLGLAIAARVMERHGGRLLLDPSASRGARFLVELEPHAPRMGFSPAC